MTYIQWNYLAHIQRGRHRDRQTQIQTHTQIFQLNLIKRVDWEKTYFKQTSGSEHPLSYQKKVMLEKEKEKVCWFLYIFCFPLQTCLFQNSFVHRPSNLNGLSFLTSLFCGPTFITLRSCAILLKSYIHIIINSRIYLYFVFLRNIVVLQLLQKFSNKVSKEKCILLKHAKKYVLFQWPSNNSRWHWLIV